MDRGGGGPRPGRRPATEHLHPLRLQAEQPDARPRRRRLARHRPVRSARGALRRRRAGYRADRLRLPRHGPGAGGGVRGQLPGPGAAGAPPVGSHAALRHLRSAEVLGVPHPAGAGGLAEGQDLQGVDRAVLARHRRAAASVRRQPMGTIRKPPHSFAALLWVVAGLLFVTETPLEVLIQLRSRFEAGDPGALNQLLLAWEAFDRATLVAAPLAAYGVM